jgi:UDP-N-acetylmuramyl pentapeptide phosphotransferase/UDP-N-acetylglucosamine-1-phosphate transferase
LLFSDTTWLFAVTFCVSLGLCIVIILTQKFHGRWSHDSSEGVQKIHTQPTPRIGGIGIFVSLAMATALCTYFAKPSPNPQFLKILNTLLIGGSVCFVVGLVEDITKKVSASARLFACLVAAAATIFYSSVVVSRVDLPGVDFLLGWTPAWAGVYGPAAVIFTCFAVAGLANAFNIVDGFNGLSSGMAIIICAGVCLIATKAGDANLALAAGVVAVAIAGFWIINWPYGNIFLGDGGAYFLGFCIAWLVVLLPQRNAGVSPWASVLLVSYPVSEVVLSVIRRIRRHGHHPGAPDKLHMHHVVYARLIRKRFSRTAAPQVSNLANGMTALFLCTCNAFIVMLAYLLYSSSSQSATGFLVVLGMFALVYKRLTTFRAKKSQA